MTETADVSLSASLRPMERSPYEIASLVFDPHDKIVTSDETAYGRARRYYSEDPYYNAYLNTITEQIVGRMGFDIDSSDPAKKEQWENIKRAVNLDDKMRQAYRSLLGLGNYYGIILPGSKVGESAAAWSWQPVVPEYCYNVADRYRILRAFFVDNTARGAKFSALINGLRPNETRTFQYQRVGVDETPRRMGGGDKTFSEDELGVILPAESQDEWVLPEDMFYLRYDLLPGELYGRPKAFSVGDDFDDMRALREIMVESAKRSAVGRIHAQIEASHLSRGQDATKVKPEVQDACRDLGRKLSNTTKRDPATGEWRVQNAIVTPYFQRSQGTGPPIKEGEVVITPIPNEADLDAFQKAYAIRRSDISMIMGVPQVLMGVPEGSNRAQSVTEWQAAAAGWEALWEIGAAELEKKYLPRAGLGGERLTHREVIPSQDAAQVGAYVAIAGLTSLFHPDELRPFIATKLDWAVDPQREPPEPKPGPLELLQAEARIDRSKPPEDGREEAAAKMAHAPLSPDEEAFRKKWDFRQTRLLAEFRLALDQWAVAAAEAFLEEARAILDGVAEQTAVKMAADPDKLRAAARVGSDKAALQRILDEYDALIYRAAQGEITALRGLPGDFVYEDRRGLDALLAVNESIAGDAISATGAEARRVLIETVRSGGSFEDASDAIRKVFDGYDTERLVNTELNRAGNAGTLDAYKEIPGYGRVRWMKSLDSLVDPVCRALERLYTDLSIEQAEALGTPPAHPNCRCRWVPVAEWSFVTGGAA